MSKHAAADLRNVVLVGHGDAGKTTLAEHLLLKMGATTRLGSVKEKSSTFDYEPDEKERGHSIDCAVAHGIWKGKEINLIDCPGYPDFFGEVVTGVSAGDLALVCVNANAGILVGTRRGWMAAEARSRARGIVVTKCDLADRAKLQAVFNDVRAAFGDRCLPYRAPAELGDFKQAWTDASVESDDALMMRYLDGETDLGGGAAQGGTPVRGEGPHRSGRVHVGREGDRDRRRPRSHRGARTVSARRSPARRAAERPEHGTRADQARSERRLWWPSSTRCRSTSTSGGWSTRAS